MTKRNAKRPSKVAIIGRAGVIAGPAPTPTGPTIADVSAAVAGVCTAFEAFRAENDAHIVALTKGLDDVVAREKVDRINAEIGRLDRDIGVMNAQLAAYRVTGGEAGSVMSAERREHHNAFNAWFRRGVDNGLSALEIKAGLSTDSNPDGGYTVPEEMDRNISRVVGTSSAMRQICDVATIGTPVYARLHNVAGTSSGWVGERDARPETNTASLKRITIPTHELYANPATTQQLLDDSFVNIEAWLSSEVQVEFAEKEGTAFVSGDGVGKPKGFNAETKVANSAYAWGSLGYTVTGAAATFLTSGGGDCLVDVVHSLRPAYRGNATWLMNDLTAAAVRKLKDDQKQYLWQPSIQQGIPSTLLGYPIAYDDNVSDLGANAYPIAFGDWRRGYKIVDRMGTRVLRDPYTNKPWVHFYTTRRVGGGVIDFAAIKLLKCST